MKVQESDAQTCTNKQLNSRYWETTDVKEKSCAQLERNGGQQHPHQQQSQQSQQPAREVAGVTNVSSWSTHLLEKLGASPVMPSATGTSNLNSSFNSTWPGPAVTGGTSAVGANVVIPSNEECGIRDVWAYNLKEEFRTIRKIIKKYNYVAMDTEFPGVVARPIGEFRSTADYQYQLLRCNVDLLRIIQLGLTFLDENGKPPSGQYTTWQFNFKFNLSEDMYAQDSIDLLQNSGIQFKKHEEEGIDPLEFAELLMTSGIVLMEEVKWLSFHSGYDFGYLLKLLTDQNLPQAENEFFELLRIYFPTIYDVKYLMKSCKNLKGGLQEVAEQLDLQRVGPQHQAGSDSLLTGMAFFKMREVNCTPNGKDMATVGCSLASFDTPKRSKCDASEIIKKLNVDCVDQGSEMVQTEMVQTEMVQVVGQSCINDQKTFKLNETECSCNKSYISDDSFIEAKEEKEVLTASGGSDHKNEGEMYSESPIKKTPYLETDIDKIDDKFMSSLYIEHPRVKQLKLKKNSNKTGVGIVESYENGLDSTSEGRHSESLSTRIDNVSFSDIPSFDNLSLMVSDNEDVSLTAHHSSVCKPTVQDWLITIEDNCDNLMPFDIPPSDDVIKSEISISRDDFSDDITQSITCTPDSKKNQSLNIERTPLSCLVQNKICEPVKEGSSLKKKQWRGIQEERLRRGLSLGDENTPPFQAPLDKVSSAPGKLATRRRHIVDWDQDNSSVVI